MNSPHYAVAKSGQEFIGVRAQQTEDWLPELVHQTFGYVDGVLVNNLRVLDPNAIVYALVNAIKELAKRVEDLEKQ